MDSIYWVLSRDCNQRCAHCYNDSEPGAPGLTAAEVSVCVDHLPAPGDVPIDRIILSGGEPLVWPDLLFHALSALHGRYGDSVQLHIQTNGDLLDEGMLERCIAHHVSRIDVAGMDRFHEKATRARRPYLEGLFRKYGFEEPAYVGEADGARPAADGRRHYAFWGATEDTWIGPIWPRGRARRHGASKAGPEHRFCSGWSGAARFLDYRGEGCEVNVQLAEVYPCCPMTVRPVGSLLEEPLFDILDRCAEHPVFQALNEGRPEAMGEHLGISEEEGFRRSRVLGNHCLWCDEFFSGHAPELLREEGGSREEATRRALPGSSR